MKICLIYDFLTEAGGLEREMANHAKMLMEDGFDVEVLTYCYDKEVLKRTGFSGIKVKNISVIKTKYEFLNIFLSIFLSFLGIYKLKENPDLFITYSFPANFLIRDKKIKKINFMNHYPHFLYLEGKEKITWALSTRGFKRLAAAVLSWPLGWYFKSLDKKLVRKNDLCFANSKFTKKRLDNIYNINSIVSYPPIGSIFKPFMNKINQKYVFVAGRIIPDKKYDWLIEICSYMKNKIPLYISGDGNINYTNELSEFAREKNVNLKFLGKLPTEDLIKYYGSALVFAFPTPGEDFGLVPAESLACGTPVVVWGDGAGPTEQVIDKVNGFWAKPYDKRDFARKLDKAIDSRLKYKNKRKIIISAKKFSYGEVKKNFVKKIYWVLEKLCPEFRK